MGEVIVLKCGAVVTTLSRISNPKGDIYHGLKSCEDSFKGFGEAYFSNVLPGVTKGWKQHSAMTLNLIVPVGTIEFFLRSGFDSLCESVRLGEQNYARLTVPPNVWMAFKGIDDGMNLLLNVASIQHDPNEAIAAPLEQFPLTSSTDIPR
jgi:dTDP-4-dehydrorhamnose 3,5-epimerase